MYGPEPRKFPTAGKSPYPQNQELQDELLAVIHKRDNTISLAAVLGVLKLVELALVDDLLASRK